MSGFQIYESWIVTVPLQPARVEDFLGFLIVAIIALVIGGLAWTQLHKDKKRQEVMQKAANDLGLAFHPLQPGDLDGRLAKFRLLQKGSSQRSSNFIVASTDQLNLVLFDYRYSIGSGKNRRTLHQTIAWIASRHLAIPQFYISPESWLSRIGDMFVRQDIDFQQDPQFSKAFVVSGPDADQIRNFLDSKRRQALLQISLPTIECFPGELMFYRPGHLTPPDQLKPLMNEAFQLYQAFASKESQPD